MRGLLCSHSCDAISVISLISSWVLCYCRIVEVQLMPKCGFKVHTYPQNVAVESESSTLATSLENRFVLLFSNYTLTF